MLQSTEAELSYRAKPLHPALPKGPMGLQHLGVIIRGCWSSHCCDVGLGRKARKGEGPSALKCMGHCRHQSPLSSFSERWGIDPLKCRASVPFPLARDIRSPPLQALGPARLAKTQAVAGSRHCAHPMDPLLLLHTHETPRCTRSGRKRWVCLGGLTWRGGALLYHLGSARLARCTRYWWKLSFLEVHRVALAFISWCL